MGGSILVVEDEEQEVEALILDGFHDLLGAVLGNALGESDDPPDRRARSGDQVSDPEIPDGHSPLDHLGAQDVQQSFHPEIIVGGQANLGLGPVELHSRGAAFEIVPLRDLLQGLIDGFIHLLQIGAGGHIKGGGRSHTGYQEVQDRVGEFRAEM